MLFSTVLFALTAAVARAAPIILDTRVAQPAAESCDGPQCTSTLAASSTNFHLQNGLDAQKLNAQFKTLTANSSCTDGQQACIGGSFAQCVAGAFQLSPCSGGTTCVVLPLDNKSGTSITCDTASDAADRIAETGATGGLDGSGSDASSSTSSEGDPASTTAAIDAPTSTTASEAATTSSAGGFKTQNGLDAQKLNAQFQTLTATSACTEGQQACVDKSFAQCVSGSFVLTPCSAGLVCAALPLVNQPGTSIACDTLADVEARISATGAAGGIAGSS